MPKPAMAIDRPIARLRTPLMGTNAFLTVSVSLRSRVDVSLKARRVTPLKFRRGLWRGLTGLPGLVALTGLPDGPALLGLAWLLNSVSSMGLDEAPDLRKLKWQAGFSAPRLWTWQRRKRRHGGEGSRGCFSTSITSTDQREGGPIVCAGTVFTDRLGSDVS